MMKTILIVGNTTGLMTNEKLERERALRVAIRCFNQDHYRVILLTENRESLVSSLADEAVIVYDEINVATIKTLISEYAIDLIFPGFSGINTLNVFRNLLKDEVFQASAVELLNFNQQNLTLSLSKRSLNKYLQDHGFRLIEHQNVQTYQEALQFAQQQTFPVIIRSNTVEQKMHWNTVNNTKQLAEFFQAGMTAEGFEMERGINNFKELTLVTLRDKFDNSALIFSSEDMDPIGVHSNDSTSVTPVFSINDALFQRLRNAVLKLTSLLKIIGTCTFHLAVDETTASFYVLEISPVFRSKILPLIASTGYPLFEVICQVSVGQRLQNLTTLTDHQMNAAVELTPNHLTARVPIWQTQDRKQLKVLLGPHQTSNGAIVVNGNNLETVIMKAFAGLDLLHDIFLHRPLKYYSDEQIEADLFQTKVRRVLVICEALIRGFDLKEVQSFTHYNWEFLQALQHLINLAQTLMEQKGNLQLYAHSKLYGFDDYLLAKFWHLTLSQAQKLTQQLAINSVEQPTATLLDLAATSKINGHYSTFLYAPHVMQQYQVEIDGYQNSDMLSNYEQVLLTHNLVHSFQDDGFSTAIFGNLLSNVDTATTVDFYSDSRCLQSHLYSEQNQLQLRINTQELNHQSYQLTIFNISNYLKILPNDAIQEVVFVQDQEHHTWLSSPITTIFKHLSARRLELTSVPGKHRPNLVKQVNHYIKTFLPDVRYGTLILQKQQVIQALAGFTTNIGLIQQINSNFVSNLGHVLLGINSNYANKQQDYFGSKVTLIQQKNGLYSSRLSYFTLPNK